VASRISEFLDERGCEDPVMTLPIKKRINTDMFIDKTEALDIYRLAMPCTGTKNIKSYPAEHFTLHKVLSPVTCLGFRVWCTLGSGLWVGRVIIVNRTFSELVSRSKQNLVEIGLAISM